AHFDKLVTVTRLLDKNRHGHDVVQAAARTLQDTINLSKYLFDLSFEIVCDIVALAVLGRGMAGNPHNRSARRDDTRRECPRQLKRCLLHVFRGLCAGCEQRGEKRYRDTIHATLLSNSLSNSWTSVLDIKNRVDLTRTFV